MNFVGVVSSWLVESHYKSGQLKHQSMPGASSEGKSALHACHCVPSSSFSIRGPLSVTIQQISGASGCQCVGHIDKTVRTDECFHVTSRQPFWSPKPILWKLNFFLMLTLSFTYIHTYILLFQEICIAAGHVSGNANPHGGERHVFFHANAVLKILFFGSSEIAR